jgi:hypothetical protein
MVVTVEKLNKVSASRCTRSQQIFRFTDVDDHLVSSVFKDMFSLPQPTPNDSKKSTVAEVEIVEVTDPAGALDIVLRMIYPFAPPSLDGDLDTLVECLAIADKYDLEGARLRLFRVLAQNVTQPLRVYAIATRFGFTKLMDPISHHICSSVHLAGISGLPDDFDSVPATTYHKLIRRRASYLKAVVDVIEKTPLQPRCSNCQGEKRLGEVFRLRLAHLITAGTPVEAGPCFGAWVDVYGYNAECKGDCVQKFIGSAISRVKDLIKPGASPLLKGILKKAAA